MMGLSPGPPGVPRNRQHMGHVIMTKPATGKYPHAPTPLLSHGTLDLYLLNEQVFLGLPFKGFNGSFQDGVASEDGVVFALNIKEVLHGNRRGLPDSLSVKVGQRTLPLSALSPSCPHVSTVSG